MKCPHCQTSINLPAEEESSIAWRRDESEDDKEGYGISFGHCPECGQLVILYKVGVYNFSNVGAYLDPLYEEEILYPKFFTRSVEPEVPEKYKVDYLEACGVLSISPKASAAISRRILQNILRDEFKVKHSSLANEIDEFIKRKDVPSYLTSAIDAIRNIGNFAAHPLKDTNTGAIIEVEAGEAEWLLEVNESLFDFAFIQPKKLKERQDKLNAKLKAIGKPPMKIK